MPSHPLRRPRWRRKRTWAATATLLALPPLYPLSEGPFLYAFARGWMSEAAYQKWNRWYEPLEVDRDNHAATPGFPKSRWDVAHEAYCDWWLSLGWRHAASN